MIYSIHINIFVYSAYLNNFFTFQLQIKLKCAECTLYSIFILKIFSTALQNMIDLMSRNPKIKLSRCHILKTFLDKKNQDSSTKNLRDIHLRI